MGCALQRSHVASTRPHSRRLHVNLGAAHAVHVPPAERQSVGVAARGQEGGQVNEDTLQRALRDPSLLRTVLLFLYRAVRRLIDSVEAVMEVSGLRAQHSSNVKKMLSNK